MSNKARIAKRKRNSFVCFRKTRSGMLLKMAKYAPRLKNNIVCGINALW
jgi:hypothetical protein